MCSSIQDLKDLDPVIDVLNLDLVSYSGSNPRGPEFLQTCNVVCELKLMSDLGGSECPADFSSNFLGGRKGSIFHKRQLGQQLRSQELRAWCFCWDSPICLPTQSFCGRFVFTKGIWSWVLRVKAQKHSTRGRHGGCLDLYYSKSLRLRSRRCKAIALPLRRRMWNHLNRSNTELERFAYSRETLGYASSCWMHCLETASEDNTLSGKENQRQGKFLLFCRARCCLAEQSKQIPVH